MSNELYTVVVSGEQFVFTKTQILSDPDNALANYFFGRGTQGTRELFVHKDAQLFKLIQAHLRGYETVPLSESAIPAYMTREVALTNLLREAQSYGLGVLANRIHTFQLEEANLRAAAKADAAKANASKTYKLANYNTKEQKWTMTNISEDGYRTHLSRFLNNPDKCQPRTMSSLKCPGYTLSISWRENQVAAPASNTPSDCGLLVSDS